MSSADTIYKSRLADMRRVDALRASQRTQARNGARQSTDKQVRLAVTMAEQGFGIEYIAAVAGVEETFARRIVTGE